MKILLLNGPNLNLLGSREKDIYGNTSLEQLESNLYSIAKKQDCNLVCYQSNAEHDLINAIHDAGKNNFDSINYDIKKLELDTDRFDIYFEKKCEGHFTSEIPDWYILEKSTNYIVCCYLYIFFNKI